MARAVRGVAVAFNRASKMVGAQLVSSGATLQQYDRRCRCDAAISMLAATAMVQRTAGSRMLRGGQLFRCVGITLRTRLPHSVDLPQTRLIFLSLVVQLRPSP